MMRVERPERLVMFMKMFRNVNDVANDGGWVALITLVIALISMPAWIFYPYTFTPGTTGAPTFIDVMQLTFFCSSGVFIAVLALIGCSYAMRRTISSVIVLGFLGVITITMMYATFGH